jgi:two-component system LytT family response regulator
MKPLRVIIADDEPLAREGIAHLLAGDPEIAVIGSCADGEEALRAIGTERPDLVFLDVQMPRRSGVAILQELAPADRPATVLITAYDQYAAEAFDLGIIDYVVKPFRDDRFRLAVTRAKERIRRSAAGGGAAQAAGPVETKGGAPFRGPELPRGSGDPRLPQRIVFRVEHDYVLLNPDDVAWIEAQGEAIKVRAGGQNHAVRESLTSVEKRLNADRFVRIHRSFIVNRGSIRRISPTLYGDHEVHLADGTRIPMSRTYRDKLSLLLATVTP